MKIKRLNYSSVKLFHTGFVRIGIGCFWALRLPYNLHVIKPY